MVSRSDSVLGKTRVSLQDVVPNTGVLPLQLQGAGGRCTADAWWRVIGEAGEKALS